MNNIKAVILDADGVVIKDHEYFSVRYKRDFGKSLKDEVITNFFKNEYKKTAVGKADLKELLEKRLDEWGWKGTVDELLKYWFEGERDVNKKVLEIAKNLREKGVKIGLASDNERYRAEYLFDEVGLEYYFDYMFFSCFLGFTKSDPKFFEYVINKLKFKPQQIIYFDDDQENVDVAKGVGIDARLYESVSQLSELL
ncbi:HAD-IA family hydrolase [Candidatus Woesebacteria bacterium]|nr:HAD-IA family hydrolase [Candidatus Woesebacteria bacterium]